MNRPGTQPPTPEALGHRAALDGIRGVAIAGVLMLHSTIWGAMPPVLPGGNLGVNVFFVLSGYLITTLLFDEHERSGTIDLRAFYIRRSARLLPGLLVLLPAYALVFSRQQSAWQLVLLIGPVILYLSGIVQAVWGSMGPLAFTWSLSVEEHFYACWPLLMRALVRRRHALALTAGVAAVIVAVATAIRTFLALHGSYSDDLFSYYATPTRIDALAVGCLAAVVGRRRWRPLPSVAGWVALAAIIWAYRDPDFAIGGDPLSLYGLPISEGAAAVLILTVVGRPRSLLSRALSFRPLVHLGVVSYGLYLWNLLPGQTWTLVLGRHPGTAGTMAMFAVVFAAVELSYRFVERPAMRWTRARLARADTVRERSGRTTGEWCNGSTTAFGAGPTPRSGRWRAGPPTRASSSDRPSSSTTSTSSPTASSTARCVSSSQSEGERARAHWVLHGGSFSEGLRAVLVAAAAKPGTALATGAPMAMSMVPASRPRPRWRSLPPPA